MKSAEYLKGLRGKSAAELNEELAALRKEQFNLRIQAATGQSNQSHFRGDVRRKIARVKTMQQQQAKKS